MFCDLHAEALTDYMLIGLQRTFARGERIFEEDDWCRGVFIICTGQVKLSCTSRGGKTLISKIGVPGDILGLGAVISGSTYEARAEPLMPTVVKNIQRIEFLTFLQKYPEASLHAALALSEDYKTAFVNARRLTLSKSVGGRLAGALLERGKAAASCGKSEMRFTMALTHEELGNSIGTSRETLTRTIGRFKKEGLIQVRGSSIHILAANRLEKLAC